MLSVPRLRVLREVAHRGSFSAAATSLSYTQSAVSQQIAALEAEAGMALVERHPRGVTLTAAGQTLVAHAESILAGLDAAEGALAEIAGLRGGRLRIGAFPTASSTLLPPAIAMFRSAYPEVELTLTEGEPEQLAPLMSAGELDLGVLFEFAGEDPPLPGMARSQLLEDAMLLALPREHRLAARRRVRLEDLRGERWVQTSLGGTCARHVVRSCHAAGFEPQVAFESDDYQTVQGLVATGVGVAVIPALALTVVREDIVIRELSPAPAPRQVLAAVPETARLVPAAPAMLGMLEALARERAGSAPAAPLTR